MNRCLWVLGLVLWLSVVHVAQGKRRCLRKNRASIEEPSANSSGNLNLLASRNSKNAIKIEKGNFRPCCYSYDEGKCYNSTIYGLVNNLDDCNIKDIDEWESVSSDYQFFQVISKINWIKRLSFEIKFTIHPCGGLLAPLNSSTVNNPEDNIRGAEELLQSEFVQHNFTQSKSEVMERVNRFRNITSQLALQFASSDTTKLSVPEIANVDFGQIPDVNHIFTSEADGSTQLLEFGRSEGRKKRSTSIIVFVFTQLILELSEMRPFYLFRDTTSSFWQIANHTSIHPSTVAPYLDIQAYDTLNGSQISVNLTFAVNMTADMTLVEEAPEKLFDVYRSWYKISSLQFICLRLNFTGGRFTRDGCMGKSVNGVVSCSCDQPGFFTVAPQITAQVRPDGINAIFYGGLVVGLILLFVTSMALLKFSDNVECDRIAVQISVVCSLFLLHFVLLFEGLAIKGKPQCEAVTFICHYFMMTTGLLAFADGATILANLFPRSLRFKRQNPGHLLQIQLAICLGIPLIIAGITIGVALPQVDYISMSEYGYERCWINHNSFALVAGVTVPIAIIFIACFLLAILIFAFASSAKQMSLDAARQANVYDVMTTDDVDIDHVFRMLVEYVMTCIALLVPWIKYFIPGIHNFDVTFADMYVTMTLIGLQGIFVFIIYVIVSPDVRRAFCGSGTNYSERYQLYWYGPERAPDPIPLDTLSENI